MCRCENEKTSITVAFRVNVTTQKQKRTTAPEKETFIKKIKIRIM